MGRSLRVVRAPSGVVVAASAGQACPLWAVAAAAASVAIAMSMVTAHTASKRAGGAAKTAAVVVAQARHTEGGAAWTWQLVRRLLWESPKRRRVIAFLLLLLVALVVANMVAVAQSFAQRDYMTALAQRNFPHFMRSLGRALSLCVLATPARCLVEFSVDSLAITCRDSLVECFLKEYFSPQAVYWLRREEQVTDPDMRIAVEVGRFSDSAVLMVRDVLESGLKLLGFIGVVFTISKPLCITMILYSFVGAAATVHLFGRPLVSIDRKIRAHQSSFRAALARGYERAEPLAFSGGAAAEEVLAFSHHAALRQQQWSRLRWRTSLAGFRDGLSWVSRLLPVAMVVPLWLRGEIDFGVFSQVVSAFEASLAALSVVVRKFRSVSSLVSDGGRLQDLAEALGRAAAPGIVPLLGASVSACVAGVSVEGLSLSMPSGAMLCKNLSLAVRPGQRMLVLGDSGTGKTTLIRALAGLWPHAAGHVQRPASSVFLSQDPYIPEGSLRRVLTFPAPEGTFSDTAVADAARAARLSSILERYDLNARADWETVLSPGELQRCCFCRVLLARPDLAVLDEATSALDVESEAALYAALQSPCIITVSRRASMCGLHTHVLQCKRDGHWVFKTIQQVQGKGAYAKGRRPGEIRHSDGNRYCGPQSQPCKAAFQHALHMQDVVKCRGHGQRVA